MKRVFILLCCNLFLNFNVANAQSFAVAHDTVTMTVSGTSAATFIDSVINLTTGVANIQWKVIATNFPADWATSCSGFCDPTNCYTIGGLWPSGTTMNFPINPGGEVFNLNIDFSCAVSTGCYYITVRMNNAAIPADTATETFIICNPAATGIAHTGKMNGVVIYPNPAGNELNVIYDASADVKTIVLYNVIGKVVTVYKTTNDHGARLNLDDAPEGIYFVKLINSHSGIVSTQKFTRQ